MILAETPSRAGMEDAQRGQPARWLRVNGAAKQRALAFFVLRCPVRQRHR